MPDKLTTPHPDKIDDVLEVAEPGTSDAAKSDPKKKDTTYKENTTSPDELISLDELYTVTGQETLEIMVDGYRDLKDNQRLSRAHGDAVNLDTSKWIEFSDKSNALRYGEMFTRQLAQSLTTTFTDTERFTRVLLKRSQERGATVRRLMHRIREQKRPVQAGTKHTVYIHDNEGAPEGVYRLHNVVVNYPLCHDLLATWVSELESVLGEIRQAPDRDDLYHALNRFNDMGALPAGVVKLCQLFCGNDISDTATPRQLYLAIEKNMRFKDVQLEDVVIQQLREVNQTTSQWFVDEQTPVSETSRCLSRVAQCLMDSFSVPVNIVRDNELLFAFMEAQRTCTRLSMVLDMLQGLLQSLSVVIFTALRALPPTEVSNANG